jgi:hypothetical protein
MTFQQKTSSKIYQNNFITPKGKQNTDSQK